MTFIIISMNFPQNPEHLTDFEKQHIPAVTLLGLQVQVSVGERPHIMQPDHYIEWIELYDGKNRLAHMDLTPAQKPEMIFNIGGRIGFFVARAQCSQHGLWQSGWI